MGAPARSRARPSPRDVMLWLAGISLLAVTSCTADERRCEEITIPMCKGLGYNHTYMPNQFNHMTQAEAGLEVGS